MGTELNSKLFSVADSLRSKMDASEYKNYLLGLIFYKYLSDKLLEKVVELVDDDMKGDLIETLVDTLRKPGNSICLMNTVEGNRK